MLLNYCKYKKILIIFVAGLSIIGFMIIRRTIIGAVTVIPLLSACAFDEYLGVDYDTAGSDIGPLVGTWYLNRSDRGDQDLDSMIVLSDGSYTSTYTYACLDGSTFIPFYEFVEDGRMSLQGNVVRGTLLSQRERFANQIRSIENSAWNEAEILYPYDFYEYTLMLDGSMLLFEDQSDSEAERNSIDFYRMFYFRQGASNLPGDESLIQGTWYWRNASGRLILAFRFEADKFELIDGIRSRTQYYSGTYTYKDGIVFLDDCQLKVCRDALGNDCLNEADPFESAWQNPSLSERNCYVDGLSVAFVVQDNSAYVQFNGYSPILIKAF